MIGVNGYANGVDAFVGLGDTIIRDSNSSHTLNFSTTALTDIAEIDAAGGNDVVTASNVDDGNYRGGSGNDTLNAGDMSTTWRYDSSPTTATTRSTMAAAPRPRSPKRPAR